MDTSTAEGRRPDTREKVLRINLDAQRYGSFAEIGAGQEVVRWFFRVGGAAGTIAKTMSAYDMTISDVIYGEAPRYVSRQRLDAMLTHDHERAKARLTRARGDRTGFFTFADTVTARGYRGTGDCHAWMGLRFQARPHDDDSQIILHVRMLDAENLQQQEALGIVGVNLIYGAFYLAQDPSALLESLLDGLSTERIEIDLIEFSGIEFRHVDNRVMSLRLVQLGLTKAAMFTAKGEVQQPSEVLYKKAVLVQRGRFRPPTLVNEDMQRAALARFRAEPENRDSEVVPLLEMTLSSLSDQGEIDYRDFLDRVDLLAGQIVMISDYQEYFRLTHYLARQTSKKIGLALGTASLEALFDESYYEDLEGGILEAFGRLFRHNVRLYVHPQLVPGRDALKTAEKLDIAPQLHHLHAHLYERGFMVPLEDVRREILHIYSDDVLAMIRRGEDGWQELVPDQVAALIRERDLFAPR